MVSFGITAQDSELNQVRKIKGEISKDTVEFYVSLPESYNSSNKVYPVVYHLHGMNEYYISERSNQLSTFFKKQAEVGKLPEVIIVFPDGKDGFWGDHYDSYPLLETNLIKEIIPFVDQSYRTDKNHILMGWSAGGIGALNFYTKNPELFNGVVSLDGAVLNWKEMLTFQPQKANQITNSDSVYYYKYFSPNQWIINDKNVLTNKKTPSFLLVASFFKHYHQKFLSLLQNNNIAVNYYELNCEHDFNCVFSESKEKLVNFINGILEDPAGKN
jgi:S-formylglutathione hydrolase FrmB